MSRHYYAHGTLKENSKHKINDVVVWETRRGKLKKGIIKEIGIYHIYEENKYIPFYHAKPFKKDGTLSKKYEVIYDGFIKRGQILQEKENYD